MNNAAPHFLLLSEAGPPSAEHADSRTDARHWRFVLEATDGSTFVEAEDDEPFDDPQRIELLSVVRGLEALDQPSRVTLVTRSQYVSQGLRFGLEEWRENDWQWDRFGERVPIKNADLWRRIDQALRYHQVECRMWRIDRSHDADPRKARVPRPLAPRFAQAASAGQDQTATRPTGAAAGHAGQGQTVYWQADRQTGQGQAVVGGERADHGQTATGGSVRDQTATRPTGAAAGSAGQGQTVYWQADRQTGQGQAVGGGVLADQGQTATGGALRDQTATRPTGAAAGSAGQGQTVYWQADRQTGRGQAVGGGVLADQSQTATGGALRDQTATRPTGAAAGSAGQGQTAYWQADRQTGQGQAVGGGVLADQGKTATGGAVRDQTATRPWSADSLAGTATAPRPHSSEAASVPPLAPMGVESSLASSSDLPVAGGAESPDDVVDDAPRNILRPHFLRIQDQLTPRRPRKKWRFASQTGPNGGPTVQFGRGAGALHANNDDELGDYGDDVDRRRAGANTSPPTASTPPRLRAAVFFDDDDPTSAGDVAVAQHGSAANPTSRADHTAPSEQAGSSTATWFRGLRRRVADWAQLLCDKIETQ